MKLLNSAALCWLVLWPSSVFSQLAVSTDVATFIEGNPVADDTVVRFDGSLPVTTQRLGLPDGSDLAALHIIDASTLLFSVKTSLLIDGVYGSPGDVLQWTSGSISVLASREDLGLGPGTAVDALSVQDDTLIYSIDVTDDVNGTVFTDSDLLQWTSVGGSSPFLFESFCGIPQAADVAAIHVLDAQNILLAFKTGITIGETAFRSGELVRCKRTGGAAALYERFVSGDPKRQATNVDALSVFRGTTIFDVDFESP